MQPVQQPTTSVPSAMPSITGLIATIEISKHVIASLSENEIEAIELELMSNFNASIEDITTAASGTMVVTSDDLTEDEIVDSVTSTLANELNIHPSSIEVTYIPETGEATYTITGDTAEFVSEMIDAIQQDGFEDALNIDGLSVESVAIVDELIVTVDVTVDASMVSDVDSALILASDAIQEQDTSYDIIADGILILF